jgi:hypothetical protein
MLAHKHTCQAHSARVEPRVYFSACAAVAQPSGTALLYPDDVEINFNNHFPVKAALKFRREMDDRQVRFEGWDLEFRVEWRNEK